jgi:hypothetical protein
MSRYEALGRRIDDAWRRANRDEQRFADIAFEALSSFEPDGFDLNEIGRFLIGTPVRQQPSQFSNLPVTLYRGEGFHVELLVWTTGSTAIHQHAFSGAFRVIVGSSLHSDYRFIERQRINSHLLIGDIEMIGMRLLKVGDVLPIVAGREGLVHALFHLDEPSVTLVARTGWESAGGPQYELIPPRFAFDGRWANGDERIAMIDRWLGVTGDLGANELPEPFLDKLLELDPARLFAVVSKHPGRFSDQVFQNGFREKLAAHHPLLADRLPDVARFKRQQSALVTTRRLIKDPDLRFFVALLLNAGSRPQILDTIRERHPGVDAEAQCIDWLLALGDPARLGTAFRDRSPLLLRLSMALDAAGDLAGTLVATIVRGLPADRIDFGPDEGARRSGVEQAYRALSTAPELSALFNPLGAIRYAHSQ